MTDLATKAGGSGHAITGAVRRFYEEMPFNYYSTPEAGIANIRENPILSYPDLDLVLSEEDGGEVLEIGCGAGWASNAIALHYGRRVTGVDMTHRALDRAAEVARQIGSGATFVQADLFAYKPVRPADVVVSIGVLHHTHDCRRAFDHVCGFVAKGGVLFVGLYHAPGRRVFLRMFHDILEREGEEAAFRRFAAMMPQSGDAGHLRSWFRDQVLHPQESQHTLAEVMGWLEENGLTLLSTSVNLYGDVTDRLALVEAEAALEKLSQTRNLRENTFFPGFFTVLAKKG